MSYEIKIHDVQTGEVIERGMTDEEIEALLDTQADARRVQDEIEARKAQRAEILERLGLTEDEAKILLG